MNLKASAITGEMAEWLQRQFREAETKREQEAKRREEERLQAQAAADEAMRHRATFCLQWGWPSGRDREEFERWKETPAGQAFIQEREAQERRHTEQVQAREEQRRRNTEREAALAAARKQRVGEYWAPGWRERWQAEKRRMASRMAAYSKLDVLEREAIKAATARIRAEFAAKRNALAEQHTAEDLAGR